MIFMKVSRFFLYVILPFIFFGVLFLYFWGGDALSGLSQLQFFADSATYVNVYHEYKNGSDVPLISVNSTYLGPVVLAYMLDANIYLIFLFNCFLFCVFVKYVCCEFKVNSVIFSLLLLANPLTISTLLSLNKEVFIFPFIYFAIKYHRTGSLYFCLLAFCFALFCRWHLVVFYLFILILLNVSSFIRFSRLFVYISMLFFISVMYPMSIKFFSGVVDVAKRSFDAYEGGGTGFFVVMNNMQEMGLYFLIFPFKAFHLSFGTGFSSLVNGRIFDVSEFYNFTIVALHCIVYFVVSVFSFFKGKLKFSNDFSFLAFLYLLVFVLSPIYSARYLYFAFIFVVLALLCNSNSISKSTVGYKVKISDK